MKKLAFLIILLPLISLAQPISYTEITQVDILKMKKLDGSKISVYGLYLGMSRKDAQKIFAENKQINVVVDEFNTKSTDIESTEELRLYIYNKYTSEQDKKTLLYVIWDEGSKGISSIVIYDDMANNVVGETKDFFTKKISDKSSSFYKKYLGTATNINKTSYGVTSSFYKSKNITTIFLDMSGKMTYYFKLTQKADK